MKKLIVLAAFASLSACAQSPSAIAPIPMGNAFASISCAQAQSLMNAEQQTLAALSTKQQQAMTGDAIGVFLIGVPVSSLSGNDVAGSIGASKGKVLALEARLSAC